MQSVCEARVSRLPTFPSLLDLLIAGFCKIQRREREADSQKGEREAAACKSFVDRFTIFDFGHFAFSQNRIRRIHDRSC
ncbi:hypothetical protein L596_001578 [Steinernema carpocapsae]|uniref:Uncharacterized protein n=1 Tax=Steinernema carpocapsae TaxID=34508 RepID=A0A4U8UMM8_STECR|nr:hypothetical protein L596_001578 [Steinernema carpocapsae]